VAMATLAGRAAALTGRARLAYFGVQILVVKVTAARAGHPEER
jgi:hypothetical protein